jgi:hypothetical protein
LSFPHLVWFRGEASRKLSDGRIRDFAGEFETLISALHAELNPGPTLITMARGRQSLETERGVGQDLDLLMGLESQLTTLDREKEQRRLRYQMRLRLEVRRWSAQVVPRGSWWQILQFWLGYWEIQFHLFCVIFALRFGELEALEPDIRRRVALIESVVR